MDEISASLKEAPLVHGDISGDLLHPGFIGMGRDSSDLNATALEMDKEHVVSDQPTQRQYLYREKVSPCKRSPRNTRLSYANGLQSPAMTIPPTLHLPASFWLALTRDHPDLSPTGTCTRKEAPSFAWRTNPLIINCGVRMSNPSLRQNCILTRMRLRPFSILKIHRLQTCSHNRGVFLCLERPFLDNGGYL